MCNVVDTQKNFDHVSVCSSILFCIQNVSDRIELKRCVSKCLEVRNQLLTPYVKHCAYFVTYVLLTFDYDIPIYYRKFVKAHTHNLFNGMIHYDLQYELNYSDK